MSDRAIRRPAAVVLAGLLLATAAAQEPEPAAEPPAETPPQTVPAPLDAIRDDLVGLEFEKALAAIEAFLGRPDLAEAERAEALVLRSQAHVAFGDLAAAEEDYREILRMRPAFTPDTSLTPRKGLERFRKARAALVGDLVIDVEPADARIEIDGRELTLLPEGKVPLIAGEHRVRAERPGFDPQQQTVHVEANRDGRIELRLLPNARTVVLETEPEGVDVLLDGVWVGRTARPPGVNRWTARGPARLVLENLPLGEHLFELTLDCHRAEQIRDLLTVDLLDWSPKGYPLVRMVPVRSTLVLRDGPEGASVLIDGERVGRLPAEAVEVCPGDRRVEVRHAGRVIWRRVVSLAEAEERVARVEPRPNAVLLGTESWPAELEALAERFNTEVRGSLAVPDAPDSTAGWSRLGLPADADLVIAPRSAAGEGEAAWWLYSPLLQLVTPFAPGDAAPGRPRWTSVTWGLFLVDSRLHGPALVAEVAGEGPASAAGLRVGDRLTSLGGTQVESAAQARRILSAASAAAPLEVEWLSPDGSARRGRLDGRPTVRLAHDATGPVAAAVRAAWAVVDATCDPASAPAATANLALLLSSFGRHELAAQTWRRVELDERAGIGRGTVLYFLGRDLERIGAERQAVAAYRGAAASEGTAVEDEGPRIAPAARDRLADLGVK